jgi:hypothetical protein
MAQGSSGGFLSGNNQASYHTALREGITDRNNTDFRQRGLLTALLRVPNAWKLLDLPSEPIEYIGDNHQAPAIQ